jgi:uridine phosphorylase
MYAIEPSQVERAANLDGITKSELKTPPIVVLTFNNAVLDELTKICRTKEWRWSGWNYSPYANPTKTLKGKSKGNELAVIVPPMGASPLVALCEELIYFGTESIFLLCASWGFGEDHLKKGEIHLPSFGIGIDGTSPHYGNKSGRADCEPQAHQALSKSLEELDVPFKVGGVGTCEALYRIDDTMQKNFRDMGCLSMDNGETIALYSLAHVFKTKVGILLQPYIDLTRGWSVSYMDDLYKSTCRVQARAALAAIDLL